MFRVAAHQRGLLTADWLLNYNHKLKVTSLFSQFTFLQHSRLRIRSALFLTVFLTWDLPLISCLVLILIEIAKYRTLVGSKF